MAKTRPGRRMKRWDGPEEAKEEKLTLKKRENLDYGEALRQNAENRFSLSVADLPIEVPPGGDKDVFRKNIQFFIEQNRMKPATTVAKQARISFELLRQWLRRGLARPQKGSRDSLDRLRKFFLLDSMAELWSDQLIDSLKQTERSSTAQMHPFPSKHGLALRCQVHGTTPVGRVRLLARPHRESLWPRNGDLRSIAWGRPGRRQGSCEEPGGIPSVEESRRRPSPLTATFFR